MKHTSNALRAEYVIQDNQRVSIVNMAIKPGHPIVKLPPKTRRGRIKRAWMALTGWELYGA